MKRLTSKSGFTLIELMIVVAIIGILATIAMPKFADLVAKSQEGTTKANLGAIRASVSLFYADHDGTYPFLLNDITPSYIAELPKAYFPRTPQNNGHPASNFPVDIGIINHPQPLNFWVNNVDAFNLGGWLYDATSPGTGFPSPTWGQVYPLCSHKDERGKSWTAS